MYQASDYSPRVELKS